MFTGEPGPSTQYTILAGGTKTATMRKYRYASLIANIVLLPTCIILLWLWLHKKECSCDQCFETREVIKYDTIFVKDTKPVPIYHGTPTVKKVLLKPGYTRPPAIPVVINPELPDTGTNVRYECPPSNCDSMVIYDTTYKQPDDYTLQITDTLLNNRIAARSIAFKNLKPLVVKEVTKFEKEKFKVFVGVTGTFNASNITRWGVGPTVQLSIPKIMALGATYDIHNNAYSFTALALLRFKKGVP